MSEALVIGGGPAGLAAAEELARAGLAVTVAEAKPSLGRKLLMAGKSGLNITMDAPRDAFLAAYREGRDWLAPMIAEFGPEEAKAWAEGLGQEVFTGSTGRVFPRAMKASPLLRAWLARLSEMGVALRPRWRWVGLEAGRFRFETPEGVVERAPAVGVLALGGRSWPRLGSDGAWTGILGPLGVPLEPFAPSNMGLRIDWSAHMAPHFGAPLKPVAMLAGQRREEGEAVVSARGLEGSLVYRFSAEIRAGAPLALDLLPDLSQAEVARRLARQPRKLSVGAALRRAFGLGGVKAALAFELAPARDRAGLAAALKTLALPPPVSAPIEEAISTAGGVALEGLEGTMIRALPGVFCAGEMVAWDAPTGGYLLTACLATGRAAGRQAAAYAASGLRIASARL